MNTEPLVVLRGGVSVPAAAYVLLVDLEARGVTLWREGERLIVEPADRLTAEDDRALRVLKPYLLTLLSYSATFDDRPREAAHA